jgi:hypothetical protein
MDDFVQWLRAQLDEDQRIAREAAMAIGRTGYENGVLVDPPARFGDDLAADGAQWAPSYHKVMRKRLKEDEKRRTVAECGGFGARPVADHVAAHDPARVLREIEAKRKIVDAYLPPGADPHPGLPCINFEGQNPEDYTGHDSCARHLEASRKLLHDDYVLRLLAAVYDDRPGYQDEWRL